MKNNRIAPAQSPTSSSRRRGCAPSYSNARSPSCPRAKVSITFFVASAETAFVWPSSRGETGRDIVKDLCAEHDLFIAFIDSKRHPFMAI